jgi:acyl CoA:acetate/3-ketoacid CoA transferase alpha subunit
MFNERIFRYVEDGWFESRNALSLIPELTEQAKKDLEVCNAEAPPGYGC